MRKLDRESPWLIALLAGLVSLGPLSTDMYLASLPHLQTIFGAQPSAVQLTLSLFLAGLAVGQLFWGPISDRYGRRPCLLAGVALFSVASIGCAMSRTIDMLTLFRFLQATGACAGMVLGRAVVRDLHTREQAARMLSYVGAAMGLAPIVAPIVGGYLHEAFGWAANFVAMAGMGVALVGATMLWLGESSTNRASIRPDRILQSFATLLRHRRFMGYTITVACCYAGLFAWISASALVLIQVYGLPTEYYGYCFGTVVIGYIGGTLTGGRLTMRLGLDRLIGVGAAISAAAGLVMLILVLSGHDRPVTVVLAMMFYMLGMGLVFPQGQAGALSPFPEMAGAAASLMGFLQMAASAVIGVLVGHSHELGHGTALPMAAWIAAMGVTTLLVQRLLLARK